MKRALLFVASLFLLAGCGVSNETTEAIALKALGEGGKIMHSDHIPSETVKASAQHVFIGQDAKGTLHYIRIVGEKILKDEAIQP